MNNSLKGPDSAEQHDQPKSGDPKDVFEFVHRKVQEHLGMPFVAPTEGVSIATRVNVGKTFKGFQRSSDLPTENKVARNTLAVPLIQEMWAEVKKELNDPTNLHYATIGIEDPDKVKEFLQFLTWEKIEEATAKWLKKMQAETAGKTEDERSGMQQHFIDNHAFYIDSPTTQERLIADRKRYKLVLDSGKGRSPQLEELVNLEKYPADVQFMNPRLMPLFRGMVTAHNIVWGVMNLVPTLCSELPISDEQVLLSKLKQVAKTPSWDLIEKIGNAHIVISSAFLLMNQKSIQNPFMLDSSENIVFGDPSQAANKIVEFTLESGRVEELRRDSRTGCPAFVGGVHSAAYQFYEWIQKNCDEIYFPLVARKATEFRTMLEQA